MDSRVTRPILRYHGGKWKLAPWVIANMPPHRVYVEPFGGGGSVLLRKERVPTEIYNDLDAEIVGFFKVLREPVAALQLANALELTPYSLDEYQAAYEPTEDSIEQARKTVIKSFLGQSSKGIWSRSGFDTRINDDGYISRLNAFCAVPAMLSEVAARLAGVVIECKTADQIFAMYDRVDALFYCDPPYEPTTHETRVYRHRMTSADHRALAGTLRGLRGMVMLSGYPSALYDELYGDWNRLEREALADGAKKRTECLWFNPAAWNARPQMELMAREVCA